MTIIVVGAVLYYLFFMGGINTIKGMLGGGGISNSQSNSQSNVRVNGQNVSGVNADDIIKNVNGNIQSIFQKVGLPPNSSGKSVSIQRRDDRGNQVNIQSDGNVQGNSMFASSRVMPRI